jgi:hypothetical protein
MQIRGKREREREIGLTLDKNKTIPNPSKNEKTSGEELRTCYYYLRK